MATFSAEAAVAAAPAAQSQQSLTTVVVAAGTMGIDGTFHFKGFVDLDPSLAASAKYTVDWGDGSPQWTQTGGTMPTFSTPLDVVHPYPTRASYKVTFSVDDGSGRGVVSQTMTAAWHYATPPTEPGLTVDSHGGVAPFTVTATIGGGYVDPSATKSYVINWGDGSALQTVAAASLPGGTVQIPHTYSSLKQYSIVVHTTDGVDVSSSNVPNNTAVVAVYGLTLQATADQGWTVYLETPYYAGAPLAYPHTYSMYIDWGDGKTDSLVAPVSEYHNYAQAGTHTISVKMADSTDPDNAALPQYFATTTVTTVASLPVQPPTIGPFIDRIGGMDRFQTATALSQRQWSNGAAGAVVLARADTAPDALAGVPLAAHVRGPLLITEPTFLHPMIRAEIDRVLGGPQSKKTVYILGGTGAISQGVEDGLRAAGYTVVRLGGGTRFETALKIAGQFGPTRHVLVATGFNFPDALAAGPLGAALDAPIVLTSDARTDPATAAFIRQHADVDPVGRQAQEAVAALDTTGQTVDKTLAGENRYLTATAVVARFAAVTGKSPSHVGLASGVTFPDALTGGAFCANAGEPLVLTDPLALSPETAAYLGGIWHAGVLKTVQIFGLDGAVGPNVEKGIAGL